MPPSVNQVLQDTAISHTIRLHGFANRTEAGLLDLLQQTDADLAKRLAALAPGKAPFTEARLQRLRSEVSALMSEYSQDAADKLMSDSEALAEYEGDYWARQLQDKIPIEWSISQPSPEQLIAAATSTPFEGALMYDHVKAFGDSMLKDLNAAINTGFVEGDTIQELTRRIRGSRASGYTDGVLQGVGPQRARALARTAVQSVAANARNQVFQENSDLISQVQWVATLDTSVCIECGELDGQTFDLGAAPDVPLHWNCFPGDTLVSSSSKITAVSKRWFDGDVLIIRTAMGRELTCTPNHPILTKRGFIPAQAIHKGDQVVCDGGSKWEKLLHCDGHEMIPVIQDVANALLASREMLARPMPVSPEDFHGDGGGSHVTVVGTYRLLRHSLDAAFRKQGTQPMLSGGIMSTLVPLICLGHLRKTFDAGRSSARGIMRRLNETLYFIWSSAFHSFRLLLMGVAQSFPSIQQRPPYRVPTNTHFQRDASNSQPLPVQPLRRSNIHGNPGTKARAHLGAPLMQSADDCIAAYAKLAGEIIAGNSGRVLLDDVIDIQRIDFHGHVFNLQTDGGFYTANGILVHNCRCTLVPVTKSWQELGLTAQEAAPGARASMNGEVPASQTFEEWLGKQSKDDQIEILGQKRYDLWQAGAPLSGFAQAKAQQISLDDLKAG